MARSSGYRSDEALELVNAAAAIAGAEMKDHEYASAANVSGIRTKTHTFSMRRDSRTFFLTDQEHGHGRRRGAWTGDKKTVVSACRRALRASKIPRGEIAGVDVLTEMGQVAERVSDDEVRVRKPVRLRRVGHARRTVDGIPVWSSYGRVGLNESGEIGHLEVHWPEIPSAALKEARVLRAMVDEGFKAPDVAGARPESTEAGILHSPAIGFFMDVLPAVRVVYRGDQPTVGRKATLFLDRNGDVVSPPRDVELPQMESRERPTPRKGNAPKRE